MRGAGSNRVVVFCDGGGAGRAVPGGADRVSHLWRAGGLSALQLSAGAGFSGRCGKPPGGLPAGSAGDPAALLFHAHSTSSGGAEPVAGAGGAIVRHGLGRDPALAQRTALLHRGYKSSFASARAARVEPGVGGGGDLDRGSGDGRAGLSTLTLRTTPGCWNSGQITPAE